MQNTAVLNVMFSPKRPISLLLSLKRNLALQQTLYFGASIALMKGVSLLMLPWLATQLSQIEFGQLETLTVLAILGSIVFAAGLEQTLYKYVGFAESDEDKRQVAATLYGLCLCVFLLVCFSFPLLTQLSQWLLPGSADKLHIQLIIAQVALESCIAVPLGWLRLNDRANLFFLFTAGRAVLHAMLTILFMHVIGGITAVLVAGLIAAVLQAVGLAILQFRTSGITLDTHTLKPIILYALPVIGSGLANFPLMGLDRWLIAAYSQLDLLASFAVAAKFSLGAVLLLQPFTMWWAPKRFTVLASPGGHKKALQVQLAGLSLMLFICMQIALFSPVVIAWLFPPQYALAADFIPLFLLIMLFKEATELVNIGCFCQHSTTHQFYINLSASLCGSSLMWVSAAWIASDALSVVYWVLVGLLVAQCMRVMLFYYFSQRFLPLPYPLRRVVIASLLGISFIMYTPHIEAMSMVLIFSLSLLTLFSFLAWSSIQKRLGTTISQEQ
ncbi:lipopolysaccharide biosynthesis protein [Aliivibrio kagoshimensis]|uniref:lipopolysaccharide biosynthesis protein n=1 Tax=Aliivibrio kagoshimensis TaxID=2910230 RepID=UPI003D0E781D